MLLRPAPPPPVVKGANSGDDGRHTSTLRQGRQGQTQTDGTCIR
jgi:hypothetical protein